MMYSIENNDIILFVWFCLHVFQNRDEGDVEGFILIVFVFLWRPRTAGE